MDKLRDLSTELDIAEGFTKSRVSVNMYVD